MLSAAARQGLPSAYGGLVGTGPFGAQVRDALAAESVELLLSEPAAMDTGFCVAMVEASGERTFATTVGAEAGLTDDLLASLGIGAGDAVYVSGYDLVYPHGPAIASWLLAASGGCRRRARPRPARRRHPGRAARRGARSADWLSLSAREATLLTGEADAESVARAVFERSPSLSGLVVRDGASGLRRLLARRVTGARRGPDRRGRRHERRGRRPRRGVPRSTRARGGSGARRAIRQRGSRRRRHPPRPSNRAYSCSHPASMIVSGSGPNRPFPLTI